MTDKEVIVKKVKKSVEKLFKKITYINNGICKFINQVYEINIDEFNDKLSKNVDNKLIEINNKVGDSGVIYIIIVENFNIVNCKRKIKKEFNRLKNVDKKSMSRINENDCWNKKANKCLYIGSSHDIRTRIKQHFGHYNSKSIYALYLNKWLPKINKKCKITVKICSFNKKNLIKKSNYLQIIEDLIWEAYKPLFGRQGAK